VEKIVVGIDGSAASVRAATWAKNEADRLAAPLVLLCVVENPATWSGVGAAMSPTAIESISEDDLRASGLAIISAVATEANIGTAYEAASVVGYPGECLVDASRDASLLVLGSEGHRIWSVLLGSVAMHCVLHSSCPVVIMPKLS
jgi:nucleotide-binding universal stress UspA family protein